MSNKKTTNQFIEESKKIYGDVYDYSETKYRGSFKPITLKCKLHGIFTVASANSHISKGVGCTLCKRFKKGVEKIIANYDMTKYIFEDISSHATSTNLKEKQDLFVRVICKEHGGCRKDHLRFIANGSIKNLCGTCLTDRREKRRKELLKNNIKLPYVPSNKLSIDIVKERCIKTFGTNISFDKMIYKDSKTSFTLICNKHDHLFNITLHKIKDKNLGCRFCKKESKNEEIKEQFLKKCLDKYGTKYDYSNMVFVSISKKINIVCPLHRNV